MKIIKILIPAFLAMFSITALAGDKSGEKIDWQVISGGGDNGGTSTNFVLSGTVGQTAVDNGSSTNFGLDHGYWQDFGAPGPTCCDQPGDANNDGAVNILDITKLIGYLYGNPPQTLYCLYEADANGDCAVNILDVTHLIPFLYGSGSAPICASNCPGW